MVEGTSYSSCVLYVCRDQMRLSTDEHPMMLAEPSQNEKAVREKMVEIMFEKYNVPGEYYSSTPTERYRCIHHTVSSCHT